MKLKHISALAIIFLIIVIVLANIISRKENGLPITRTVTKTNQCIITIDGINFDVTVYKNLHSGGDIFECGTDMTQIFWQRHTQRYLDFMQRYKI